jgi:hypothetical protein
LAGQREGTLRVGREKAADGEDNNGYAAGCENLSRRHRFPPETLRVAAAHSTAAFHPLSVLNSIGRGVRLARRTPVQNGDDYAVAVERPRDLG